jgi:hypothetical protein
MKLRHIRNSRPVDLVLRWRYGPLVMVAVWITIHVLVGYELVTGKMQERWSFSWIEGRRSAPLLYWIYVGGKAGALLLIDGYYLWTVFGGRKKEPIQQPQQQRP